VRVCDACFEKIGDHQAEINTTSAPHLPSRVENSSTSPGFAPEKPGEVSINDFEIIQHLGRGAFGQVLEVRKSAVSYSHVLYHQFLLVMFIQVMDKRTKKSYALKVCVISRDHLNIHCL
jgi:hypothetical protein